MLVEIFTNRDRDEANFSPGTFECHTGSRQVKAMNETLESDKDSLSWTAVSSKKKKLHRESQQDIVIRSEVETDDGTLIRNHGPPAWMAEIAYQPPPLSTPRPLAAASRGQQQQQQQPAGRVLLLVGYPGSGKSTLAECLCRVQPWKFVRVNQDELGSRQKCLNCVQRILSPHISPQQQQQQQQQQQHQLGYCPIIDRCNLSQDQRRYFTQLAQSQRVAVDVVVLQLVDIETCIRRAQARTNHPTLTDPRAIPGIVRGMQRDYQKPHAQHEGLRSVTFVRNDATLQSVVAHLLAHD
jgi:predicted kinase